MKFLLATLKKILHQHGDMNYTVNVMCVNSVLVCAFEYPFFILLNYFKFKVFLKFKVF